MTTNTSDIRSTVAESYGARVRPVLEADELSLPLVDAGACCGSAPAANSCCGPTDSAESACCAEGTSESQVDQVAALYAATDISDLPSTVTDVAFGCGNPTAIAAMNAGETVLDLGSGGGIDCFLAAKMVGESGRVIGVDMTTEMIALAQRNLAKVGATNVEFRYGHIEQLPVESSSVDVIISNCVINLSPDKDAVFREAFRVLKPGGRLQVSDIVWTHPVPEDIKSDIEAWAGCIAGALEEQDYVGKIRSAGFGEVSSQAVGDPEGKGITSANITAFKS